MSDDVPNWLDTPPDDYAVAFAQARPGPTPEPEAPWDPGWGPDPRDDADYQPPTADELRRLGVAVHDAIRSGRDPSWPEPEDRGAATLSELGPVEYVEDLIRPGRIGVVAGEEGSGKSFAIGGELSIRLAVAGGFFAGTWPILQTGPVVVMSEMHADDDYVREETTLASLGFDRPALAGRLYRLPLMTAAGGAPALTVPEWRSWMTAWLRDNGALLLVVDTATGATQVDPWGRAIQAVYQGLRIMLDEYPALAILLLVHLKKPTGRGDRRISDVLGEWGRWNDVTILLESDGTSLERVKITVRKRVRRERRIVVTKAGGLLVDPVDADASRETKVPMTAVLEAVGHQTGVTLAELAKALDVSKDTAGRYVNLLEAEGQVVSRAVGPRRRRVVYLASPTAAPPQTAAHAQCGDGAAVDAPTEGRDRRTAARTYIGAAVPAAAIATPGAEAELS